MTGNEEFDLRQQFLLDSVCVQFEEALRKGFRPTIEEFLEGHDEPLRRQLLRQLLLLEFDEERNHSSHPDIESYLARFPSDEPVVWGALQEWSEELDAGVCHAEQAGSSPTGGPSPRTIESNASNSLVQKLPDRIGRYRVDRRIGEGGFGTVLLGYDEKLLRPVAIKVAHPGVLEHDGDGEAYLSEARVVAQLAHPNIVTVYDVGKTQDQLFFTVAQYIKGQDLRQLMKERRPRLSEAVEIAATVADALQHAHRQGLVHRDIKPGNIILDKEGKPYVVDFGLALKDEQIGKGPGRVGTPAYMSPEQARGEGHRVDGRTDIYSLGAVLYEMLAGRRPIVGDSRDEIINNVAVQTPRPLRQYDERIPLELERITKLAMSKRVSERYDSAHDFARDLRLFLKDYQEPSQTPQSSSATRIGTDAPPSSTATSSVASAPAPVEHSAIITRGLRSFEAHDADFFLQLLPGPYDRDGVPDSIRFWKMRIEDFEADRTFAVGLVYGPSGCGKSSLVKAGLLPRLSDVVAPIYVEATPDQTESRLLVALQRSFPTLRTCLRLKESLAELRRGDHLGGKKALIVIDQFEQWLHAHRDAEDTELSQALRQCDGGLVQCMLMVRDDFWIAISRFLRELEVALLEGHNAALVDLFDANHAKRVLTAFGQAFGQLPQSLSKMSHENHAFLDRAIRDLARDGRVVCIRLALFAEMMKARSWTPASILEVGGMEGVGVRYLDDTFSATTAPPTHRYYQEAARAVLKDMLPQSGEEIKGRMKSRDELAAACGLNANSREFKELITILDKGTRLISPADPAGLEPAPQNMSSPTAPAACYQLTHDYLVRALEVWLTRKQKETRRGRAQLCLETRASEWAIRPTNRMLPSLGEWGSILSLTHRSDWSDEQRRVMSRANVVHGSRIAMAICGIVLSAVAILVVQRGWQQRREQIVAAGLLKTLLSAEISEVPEVISQIEPYRGFVDVNLQNTLANHSDESKAKLHASLALLPADPGQVPFLLKRLLIAKANEVDPLRRSLFDHREELMPRLWGILNQAGTSTPGQRLRAASALALFDPESKSWSKTSPQLARDLVQENSLQAAFWVDMLRPVRRSLMPHLAAVFRNGGDDFAASSVDLATNILANFAEEEVGFLGDLLFDATAQQFQVLYSGFEAHSQLAIERARLELSRSPESSWPDSTELGNDPLPPQDVVADIKRAHGLVERDFAFCQSMPIDDFLRISSVLADFGYRPSRLRPVTRWPLEESAPSFAAIWARTPRERIVESGLTEEQIMSRDAELRSTGFQPMDVAGYVVRENDRAESKYCAIWERRDTAEPDARLFVNELPQINNPFHGIERATSENYRAVASVQTFYDSDGHHRLQLITRKNTEKRFDIHTAFNHTRASYDDIERIGDTAWDIAMCVSPGTLSTYERSQAVRDDERIGIVERAIAEYRLGNLDEAFRYFDRLLTDTPGWTDLCAYRAVLHARKGNEVEAQTDIASFAQHHQVYSGELHLECVVAAHLGRERGALDRLEQFIKQDADDSILYHAARTYAAVSGIVEDEKAKAHYAQRAFELLGEAQSVGFNRYHLLDDESAFDSIREDERYRQFVASHASQLSLRYAGVWLAEPDFDSTVVTGLTVDKHLARCRELVESGYRMVAIAAASDSSAHNEPQSLRASSVWHRPSIRESTKEHLAKRKANAAIVLLRLGRAEDVRHLLRSSNDNRVRSWLFDRVSSYSVEPSILAKLLSSESEVTIRRALLTALGQYDDPGDVKQEVLPAVMDMYHRDPDSGVHSAAEWLLRRWRELDNTKRLGDRPPKSANWYITGTNGHTMALFKGPHEFLMGSPDHETDRAGNEQLHRRLIPRSFALATTEVTIDQFGSFFQDRYGKPANVHYSQYGSSGDCPVTNLTPDAAIQYCLWLSRKENLPEDQLCYTSEGKTVVGYLSKTGYRLPTEAEWEFASRSGTTTKRYYGQSPQLLPQYAWYSPVSAGWSSPVGLRIPNDFGLFDMYGNASEWCQTRHAAYPNVRKSSVGKGYEADEDDFSAREVRGGNFYLLQNDCRSADRASRTKGRHIYVGFRVARTILDD